MIKTIVVLTEDSNLIDMVEDELREIDRSIYVKITMSDTEDQADETALLYAYDPDRRIRGGSL